MRFAPLAFALMACASATRNTETDAQEAFREQRTRVQHVACFVAATKTACEPGFRASFTASRPSSYYRDGGFEDGGAKAAVIWCEDGRARGHFSTFTDPHEERTGEFSAPVWESFWRVVKATDGCVSAYGERVQITRDGLSRTCDAPRFDVQALFDSAYWTMRHGAPSHPVSPVNEVSICAIDPSACPSSPSSCPPFVGDAWNWLGADASVAVGAAPEQPPSPPDSPNPNKPSQTSVVRALSAVIPNARRCVDQIAHAKIVFRADGTVQSVVVTGVGVPAQACVTSALSKATIPTFVDPAYEASITIRP